MRLYLPITSQHFEGDAVSISFFQMEKLVRFTDVKYSQPSQPVLLKPTPQGNAV